MDWPAYKRLADQPDVWSRWMLEATLELLQHTQPAHPLRAGAARKLCNVLETAPLPKPPDHRGDARTDLFRLHLDTEQIAAVTACVEAAVAQDLRTAKTRQRGLGGFNEAWREYARLARAGARP